MRYQIHLINNPNPLTVDANEFHPMGGGVIFYKDRMRNTLGNDTWGNPRRVPARVAVAFMTNVESILEMPEEEGPVAEGVDPFGDFQPPVLLNDALAGGQFRGAPPIRNFNQMWVDETGPAVVHAAGGIPHMPAPIPVDEDGVAWDAQRNEY